jgi:TolB protein
VVVEVDTPTPTPAPQPAKVVYVQSNGLVHHLGLAKSTGELLNANLHDFAAAPTWNPNGQHVAFFGEAGINQLGGSYSAGSGIWIVDVSTGSVSLLITEDHITNMNWSPDGQRLVYEINPPPGTNAEVVVINSFDGQELNRFPGEQPAWRNDSQKLVVKGCVPECGLWMFNIDGSGGERLTFFATDSYPAWSQTGEYLAFTSREQAGNWEIYLLRLMDKELTRLTYRSGSDITPVFSPDGQEIYLRTDARTGRWQVTVINLSSGEERVIQDEVGPSDNWGLSRPTVR